MATDQGRSSFAFTPAAASQSPLTQSSFRGIGMEGGSTSIAGGVAAAASIPPQLPGLSSEFGGFINDLLAPAMERRKKEQFVKGMVDQMSATSGDEIRVNNKNPINSIFGPSSYEEGAIYYSAKNAVNTWQAKMMANMDDLKKMPPSELSKFVAGSFEAMNTGDRFTDMAINSGLIEASQPVIGAVAKERYKWQQDTALKSFVQAGVSNGDAYQTTMQSLATTADPSDPGNLAANAAVNNFRGNFVKPAGMDDETYQKSLVGLYRQFAQNGNGYAVSTLKQSGFLDLLDPQQRTQLEDAEQKYGNRALSRAAIQFAPDIDRLNFNMEFGKISSTEAMSQMATINEKVKAMTGFDQDLFDYKDVTGAGKNVWGALHTQMNRQQERQWQLEDRAAQQKFELDKIDRQAHDEAAQVQVAYASGNVKTAQAAGIGSTGNFDILAQADYAKGDWSNMLRAYDKDGWTSGLVQSQVQAQVQNSMGTQYNKDFEQGYQKFHALNTAKPAAAMAYYGDLYTPMLAYERLITSGNMSGTDAFARAFANPAQYAPAPQIDTKTAKSITDWVDKNRGRGWIIGGGLGFGRQGLTSSGKSALVAAMGRQLGVMAKNTDMPMEALIPNLYQQVKSSGAYEDYGRLGWTNKPGTPNLGQMLGLQQDEADEVVSGVIDNHLKLAGDKDGIKSDNLDIRRIKDARGNTVIAVTPYDEENGAGAPIVVPFEEFKRAADATRADRVRKYQAPSAIGISMSKSADLNKRNIDRANAQFK